MEDKVAEVLCFPHENLVLKLYLISVLPVEDSSDTQDIENKNRSKFGHTVKLYQILNTVQIYYIKPFPVDRQGGVAQMVERSLSMREVPGSIPGISRLLLPVSLPVML